MEEEDEGEGVDGFSGCRRRRRRAGTKENINNRVQMRQWPERGRRGPSRSHTRRLRPGLVLTREFSLIVDATAML